MLSGSVMRDIVQVRGTPVLGHRVTTLCDAPRLCVTGIHAIFRHVGCYLVRPMQPSSGATAETRPPSSDIVFACTHCATQFVVDAAAAGATVKCDNCSKPTTVPLQNVERAPGDPIRVADLQHQLKENESQRTEVSGYINQLTIQVQRWQLRLQTLNERHKKLQAELAAITNAKS